MFTPTPEAAFGKGGLSHLPFRKTRQHIADLTLEHLCRLLYLKRAKETLGNCSCNYDKVGSWNDPGISFRQYTHLQLREKKLSTQGLTHLKWINLYILDYLLSYYFYCASLYHTLSLCKKSGGKIKTLLVIMCFPGGTWHLISTDSELWT